MATEGIGKPVAATRMAKAKSSGFKKNVLTHVEGPGRVVADSWRFIPLCADTAGGWDDAAIDTLQKCAAYVDKARRGHVVGLYGGKCYQWLSKANMNASCATKLQLARDSRCRLR